MTSIVTHHLTAAGLALFPGWFERLRDALDRQPGFVALRAFADASHGSRRVLILEMRSEADLSAWVEGPEKRALLREIEAVSSAPWTATRLCAL